MPPTVRRATPTDADAICAIVESQLEPEDAAEARYAQQVAIYGRSVLTAVGEVESALLSYREERARYELLQAQLDQAIQDWVNAQQTAVEIGRASCRERV